MEIKCSNKNEDFIEFVRLGTYDYSKDHEIIIDENELVLAINSTNKNVTVLGCPDCFNQALGQDKYGYPTLGDKPLISVYEIETQQEVPPVVGCNLWLCARCHRPIVDLMPQFI
jgi:hypothetical protein